MRNSLESHLFLRYLIHQTSTTNQNNKIMTRFFKIIAITGQEFLVRPNYTAKTFTIKTNGTTYRTVYLNGQEFNECEYNTGNDWAAFMKSGNYYKVK